MSETVNACANCGHDRRNHGDDKAPQWERPCGVMGGSGPCDCPGFRAGLTGAPRDADLSALREALREPIIRAVAQTHGYGHPNVKAGDWWDVRCEPVLVAVLRVLSAMAPRETAAAPALDIDELAAAIRVEGESGRWGDEESHTFRFMNETLAGLLIETVRAARLSASGTTE